MTRAVLLDLSGVLYAGAEAIPGSIEAVTRLREAGLGLRFLTNSTRSPRRVLLEKLDRMGFDVASDELFTPARAVCDALAKMNATAHLLIHPDLAEDFRGIATTGERRTVVVGDAGEHFTYDAMNAAFRALDGGADLLALAANRSFLDLDDQRSIDVGAFVQALSYASGVEPRVFGKPARGFFDAALDSLGCPADRAVMVGDDAEADVAGASHAGVAAAVLVRTGKFSAGDETAYDPAPSHVADDLAAAVDWILNDRPEAQMKTAGLR